MEFTVIHCSVDNTASITGNANYWVEIIPICFKKKKGVFLFFNVAVLFCLETKSPYVDQKLPI